MSPGTLYLIPVPLGTASQPDAALPAPVLARIHTLKNFVVENAKSARAFLKAAGTAVPLQDLLLEELNEHTRSDALDHLLSPLRKGEDIGLLSEAGCPAVADPGASLVALAQQEGIRVTPLVGPSSILLALMASGLDGQRFAFHGYLPPREPERQKTLRELENESRKRHQTQIFIETPYRNGQMLDSLLKTCQPATRITVATALTLPDETITTHTVSQWKNLAPPNIERRPTVFLLLA